MTQNVGRRIVQALADGGVGAMFGVPGGQTLPLYAAAAEVGFPHILMRDERGAACAADAYARLSGKVGFCDATVGPGATNLVSGLAEALGASIPVIAVVADLRRGREHLRRRSVASQAIDQNALLVPVTKWVARVDTADAIDSVLDQALRVATTGRPGPVALTIPEDVFLDTPGELAERRLFGPELFNYPRFRPGPSRTAVAEAVQLLSAAERPIILAGGGVIFSDASAAVVALAHEHGIPIATSVSGKGTIDEHDPLAAGVAGSFGTVRANAALSAADVVLILGCKLGQITTHKWHFPTADQIVIHVDVDGEEIGRTGPARLGIVADAQETAIVLAQALEGRRRLGANWLETIEGPASGAAQHSDDGSVAPHRVVELLADSLRPDDVLVCDASLSSGWAAAFMRMRRPLTYIAPRGLAGIGWGGGAMIGARLAVPSHHRLVLLTGDGAWGYCLGEFETAARLDLDLTCIVLNNQSLGWIAHIEERRGQPLSEFSDADFAAVANAMGGRGCRASNLEEYEVALWEGLTTPGPYLIDVQSSASASPVLSLKEVPVMAGDAYHS